jgi:hypothetical protein
MFEVGLPFKNGKEIILVGKSKQVLMVTTWLLEMLVVNFF